MGESQVQYFDEIPFGWMPIKGAMTAPVGYEWISNGKSRFSADYRIALVKEVQKKEKSIKIPITRMNIVQKHTAEEEKQQEKQSGFRFSDEPGINEQLNRLAREEMKLRLLKDIAADITICKMEGWEYNEYLRELQQLIGSFLDGGEPLH